MSVGAFIVARLSSSRLPAKNIMKIMDKPMIELLVERVRQAEGIDKIVIATSSLPSDDPLEAVAKKLNIGCHRGSLENIMERIVGAANQYSCDTIVEVLGDNPLIHSSLIDGALDLFQSGNYDYAATLTREYELSKDLCSPFLLGVRVQVYSSESAGCYREYPEYMGNDDKHPSAFMFEHPLKFSTAFFQAEGPWASLKRPALNFAVNYRKNFEFARAVFERLYPQDPNFSLEKVLSLMDENPYLYQLIGSE